MANSGFLIAATSSGCGKTTFSLGLMRALKRRGLNVQPFKCGPDYIDTQFHSAAAGNASINLDIFMASREHMGILFNDYASDADIAVVEGVMGMFDGFSKMSGSSADISLQLSLPIILLVNAASTAYSVAATVYGFKNFLPDIKIAGVVFNRVASESHFSFLKDACTDAGVECLGYIKRNPLLATPSRHLGLTLTAAEEMENFINAAADAVEENVDIDKILSLTQLPQSRTSTESSFRKAPHLPSQKKIAAVAYDEAFNFIYPANIKRLRDQGFEIKYFSPIHDSSLPMADFVYIPGGYPELFAKAISANLPMINSIINYAEEGGRIWAECGGLIYLCRQIDGEKMCGIFPLDCTMENSKLTLGYRKVTFSNQAKDQQAKDKDVTFKGHEFHYSRIINPEEVASVAVQENVKGKPVATPAYRYKNVFASYTHLYWVDDDIFKLWEL